MNERKSREGVNREPTILFAPNDRAPLTHSAQSAQQGLAERALFAAPLIEWLTVLLINLCDGCVLKLQAKAMKNVRWYNPRINKHSWENPDELLEWKPVYNPEREYCPTLKSLLSTRQYCIINWWYCVVHCGVLLIEEQGNGWTEWKLVYN
eukprot:1159820-Pelagomonas_calceolata.AAC.4